MFTAEKPGPPQQSRLNIFVRHVARRVYAALRPVARPLAWRGRTFLTSPLQEDVANLRQGMAALREEVSALREEVSALREEVSALRSVVSVGTKELLRASTERVLAAQRRTERGTREILSRLTAYAGENITLCYLTGRIPILVNGNDDGVPAALVSGTPWEPENLSLLLSFVRPDSIILDVGANVGVFSVVLGRRLGAGGHVHALEPHPGLAALLRRNIILNSLEPRITVHQLAASDAAGEVKLFYPANHLGQGSIHLEAGRAGQSVVARAVRLDEILPPDFRVDIVKLDVEKHEAAVLRGMAGIIGRSPGAIFLLEKIESSTGGHDIWDLMTGAGHRLYGVGAHAELVSLDVAAFHAWSGYVVAGHEVALGKLKVLSFSVYPAQLKGWLHAPTGPVSMRARGGEVLFSGPGWPLPAGRWKLRLIGEIRGALNLQLAEQGGDVFAECDFSDLRNELVLDVPAGIECFEVIGTAGGMLDLTLERLELMQVRG